MTVNVDQVLLEGDVAFAEQIPWGSNYTFAVELRLGAATTRAIYKPRKGERPLWDFPPGTLYLRERAAYLASQALGWPFIPLTLVRDGPHGVGSMQLYVEGEPFSSLGALQDLENLDLGRIAAFDIITNNADRKGGHVLLDGAGKLWGIDHGLCFNVDPKVRTVLQSFCGETVPAPVLSELVTFLEDPSRVELLRSALDGVITPQEFEVFLRRVEGLSREGCYPRLDYYRSLPWPAW